MKLVQVQGLEKDDMIEQKLTSYFKLPQCCHFFNYWSLDYQNFGRVLTFCKCEDNMRLKDVILKTVEKGKLIESYGFSEQSYTDLSKIFTP